MTGINGDIKILELDYDSKNNAISKSNVSDFIEKIIMMEKELFNEESYNRNQIEEMIKNKKYSFYLAINCKNKEMYGYLITYDTVDLEEIIKIGVSLTKQRAKIGQQLMEYYLGKQRKETILEVRESNIKAIRFYEKNGFTVISKRKGYYSNNNEAALIMKNIINSAN